MQIVPFEARFTDEVLELIVAIQREEFGIDITAEQQPDLATIPTYYQTGLGNFWVAIVDGHVVGTISLLDIGGRQAALRKMFVARPHRGSTSGTAARLLATLFAWAHEHGVEEIYLGTTDQFRAAHRFYEKHGFEAVARDRLPDAFPVMEVDSVFYRLALAPSE